MIDLSISKSDNTTSVELRKKTKKEKNDNIIIISRCVLLPKLNISMALESCNLLRRKKRRRRRIGIMQCKGKRFEGVSYS